MSERRLAIEYSLRSIGAIYLIILAMIYALLALLIGGAAWYGIAYARYGNVKLIDELRANYKQLQHDYRMLNNQLEEYVEQNRILKHKSQSLLDQNEDFAKMVSELSRYYFHLKQGAEKAKELVDIMAVYDEQIEQSLREMPHHQDQRELPDPEQDLPKQFF